MRRALTLDGTGQVVESYSEALRSAADAARAEGLRVTNLDPHSGYLAVFDDGVREVAIAGGAACPYPVNGGTAVSLAKDKTHAAALLARAGLPVPRGAHFFTSGLYESMRGTGKDLSDAVNFAAELGFPVFVKPNDGARGAHAGMVDGPAALTSAFEAMAVVHPVALVQEALRGTEWRLVVYREKIRWAYERSDAVLTGDGTSSVAGLLADANRMLQRVHLTPVPETDPFLLRNLDDLGWTLGTVPDRGRTVSYTPRRNVSGGGGVSAFHAEPPAAYADLAIAATQALGLTLAGVDLLVTEVGPVVLEVNGQPALGGISSVGEQARVSALWRDVLLDCLADPALSRPLVVGI